LTHSPTIAAPSFPLPPPALTTTSDDCLLTLATLLLPAVYPATPAHYALLFGSVSCAGRATAHARALPKAFTCRGRTLRLPPVRFLLRYYNYATVPHTRHHILPPATYHPAWRHGKRAWQRCQPRPSSGPCIPLAPLHRTSIRYRWRWRSRWLQPACATRLLPAAGAHNRALSELLHATFLLQVVFACHTVALRTP